MVDLNGWIRKNRTYTYLAAISISPLAFPCSGFVIISSVIGSCHPWELQNRNIAVRLTLLWPTKIKQSRQSWNNQSSKQIHVTGTKRGKRVYVCSKPRLIFVLLLIGWESGTRYFSQSQSVAMQNQSYRKITVDTQWKPHYHFLFLNRKKIVRNSTAFSRLTC